jgi:hypothetical protein
MSQDKAIAVTNERENSAIKFKEFAEKYFDQFPDNLRNEYVSRVLKTFDPNVFPDMREAFIRERAIGLLAEDILNGKLQSI